VTVGGDRIERSLLPWLFAVEVLSIAERLLSCTCPAFNAATAAAPAAAVAATMTAGAAAAVAAAVARSGGFQH